VRERFSAFLRRLRQQQDRVPVPQWELALRLGDGPQLPGLLRQLEEAWFRGEIQPYELPRLVPALAAAAPAAAPAWLARCPGGPGWPMTRVRAAALVALRQPAQAARAILEDRRRALWSPAEESEAFGLWRRWALPEAPESWRGALAVWRGGDLGARLRAHPYDALAAAYARGSLAPLGEDAAARADLALRPGRGRGEDRTALQVRAARALLPVSPRAARKALGQELADPSSLVQALAGYPAAQIDAALADLARIAARCGDEAGTRAILAVLADRGAAGPQEPPQPPGRADPFKIVDGRPAPLRPRDLTWATLAGVLKQEGAP